MAATQEEMFSLLEEHMQRAFVCRQGPSGLVAIVELLAVLSTLFVLLAAEAKSKWSFFAAHSRANLLSR